MEQVKELPRLPFTCRFTAIPSKLRSKVSLNKLYTVTDSTEKDNTTKIYIRELSQWIDFGSYIDLYNIGMSPN